MNPFKTLSRWSDNVKKISKETGKSRTSIWLDIIASTVVLQSGMTNYVVYKFYNMPWSQRRTYFTLGDQAFYYRTLMPHKYQADLRNKVRFHRAFSEFTGRVL